MTPELAELSRTIDAKKLGRRIKATRIAAGLTQAQLAGEDVTTPYISRIEAGQRRPGAKLLERLAIRMGSSLEELLVGADGSRSTPVPAGAAHGMEVRVGVEHAELALLGGDSRRALDEADAVLAAMEGADDDLRRRALLVRASALEGVGELDQAIVVLEDLTATPTADAQWVKALISLSRCYRVTGDIERAIAVGEKAAVTIEELGLAGLTESIQLSLTVAGAYIYRGDHGHALRLCMRALESAQRHGSPIGMASAYWNASIVENERGNAADALALADKALALFQVGDDLKNLARLRLQIANLMLQQDPPDPRGALQALDQADREAAWAPAAANDVANHARTRAEAYLHLGEFDEAGLHLDDALRRAPQEAPALQAGIRTLQGQLAFARGDAEGARSAYRQAAHLLTAMGADRGAAQSWFELGNLFDEIGDSEGAARAFRSAAASVGVGASGMQQLSRQPH